MRLIDEQYTKTPFYGSPRMCCVLRQMGYQINEMRVERLMRLMVIQAIYTNKNMTKADIVAGIAEETGLERVEALKAVESFINPNKA